MMSVMNSSLNIQSQTHVIGETDRPALLVEDAAALLASEDAAEVVSVLPALDEAVVAG